MKNTYDSGYNEETAYMNDIGRILSLDKMEKEELLVRIANGDEEAKKTFVEANLRLVISVAKKFTGKGLPLLDLIQEGNIGLIKAVEKFDSSRGFQFSTFAVRNIKGYITRAIDGKSRMVKLPFGTINDIKNLLKVDNELVTILGRKPKIEEISQKLGISPSDVRELIRLNQETFSLDFPNGEDEELSLGDMIANPNDISPEDATIRKCFIEEVKNLVSSLNEIEQQFIALRYGHCYSHDKIAQKLGLPFYKVKRMEYRILHGFRKNIEAKMLQNYIAETSDQTEELLKRISR